MKYLNKKFQVNLYSKKFDENYEKIFRRKIKCKNRVCESYPHYYKYVPELCEECPHNIENTQ